MRNGDESCPKGRALFAPTWFVPGRTRETPDSGEPLREVTLATIDVNEGALVEPHQGRKRPDENHPWCSGKRNGPRGEPPNPS